MIDERIIVSTRNLHKEDLFRVANKTSLKELRWKVSAARSRCRAINRAEEAGGCYRSLGSEYFCNDQKESYWLLYSDETSSDGSSSQASLNGHGVAQSAIFRKIRRRRNGVVLAESVPRTEISKIRRVICMRSGQAQPEYVCM